MRSLLYTTIALAASVKVVAVDKSSKESSQDGISNLPSLAEASLVQLQTGLTDKQFTSVDLVKAYVARILEVNQTLAAVTEINRDAIKSAKDADDRRAQGKILSPLDGVPVLIKGNIGTKDRLSTTAGSLALLGSTLPEDSTIAAKLRAAGAILLGKSNLSQWANFRSYNTSNGWSAYGGQCEGAYYPHQDPLGSSSGSGVASSIGLVWASLGTETSGSILFPSSFNNVVGIKPTVGLTSRYLVVPISEHQDTVGPIARTVTDAAYLLSSIAGVDSKDNYTLAIPDTKVDYVAALNTGALQGARIGVAWNVLSPDYFGVTPVVNATFIQALDVLRANGATIVDAPFTAYDDWFNHQSVTAAVTNADFVIDIKKYLSKLASNPRKVTDIFSIRNFTQSYQPEQYPSRDTMVWDAAIDQGYDNTDPRFWPAYQQNLYYGGEGGVLGALSRNNLDAIVLPTDVSPDIPALVGSPVINVPLGFYPQNQTVVPNARGDLVTVAPGIPFGISFLGKRFDEATLIGLAYAFEQKTKTRLRGKPYLSPKTEIKDVKGR